MREDVVLRGESLVEAVARRNAGITWSLAADHKLEQLVRLANERGAGTNRRELLSAIVCAFAADESLVDLVIRHRTARVSDVLASTSEDSNVIRIEAYGPGPRRSRAT